MFDADPDLNGDQDEYFRYDVSGSSWSGPYHTREYPLARVWYDPLGHPSWATGYYLHYNEANVLATMKYAQFFAPLDSTRTYAVSLDLLDPADAPRTAGDGPSAAADAVDVDVTITSPPPPPTADFAVEEDTHTWKNTEQHVDGSLSTAAPGALYQWRFDSSGSYTAWSSDPIYDFAGHTSSGNHTVTLRVKNPDGQIGTKNRTFSVDDTLINIIGQTYIGQKSTYIYRSNTAANWLKEYPPAAWDSLEFWGGSDSAKIVWPAGEYDARLRQQGYAPITDAFRRKTLDIEVCTDCGPQQRVVGADATTRLPASTFGGGPILVREARVIRLYDLLGGASQPSAFSDGSWLRADMSETSSPGATALAGGGTAAVTPVERSAGAVAVDVDLANFWDPPIFAFAWDPDVGPSASDDRSGYDADLGLVYAYEETGAVGLVIEKGNSRVGLGVRQYGARRWAPQTDRALRAAVGEGIDLLDQADDVQFILTALGDHEEGRYRVRVFEADDVAGLRKIAMEGSK